MRLMLLSLLLLTSIATAQPTTRPSLDDLRPHYTGPVAMTPSRARESQPDQALSHYVNAQPVPYGFWGYGYGYGWCYGWGGWFYP